MGIYISHIFNAFVENQNYKKKKSTCVFGRPGLLTSSPIRSFLKGQDQMERKQRSISNMFGTLYFRGFRQFRRTIN